MVQGSKKKVIDKLNVYCLLTKNGFNNVDKIGVDDITSYIIGHYYKDPKQEAIDSLHIINLLPTEKIKDPTIIDMWKRYHFCELHPSVPPYPGAYDDIPKLYVEFCELVNRCKIMQSNLKREMNGK